MTFAEATVKYFQTTKGQAFWKKYSSKTLVQEFADEMANVKTLPTIVAANLALERLVENGDVERTDGKNVDYDNAEIILAAQKRLASESGLFTSRRQRVLRPAGNTSDVREKARRPLKSGVYGAQLCALVEQGGYQQSKAHDPEPELELLFTQAETAW
jgi:hypothetical protein